MFSEWMNAMSSYCLSAGLAANREITSMLEAGDYLLHCSG